MSELAAAFNYSEKYLGRIFKTRSGQSIKAYCSAMKVMSAKRLLVDTKLSVADIALQVGFNSVTYFDRVFSRITGLTPQQYREALNKTKKEMPR